MGHGTGGTVLAGVHGCIRVYEIETRRSLDRRYRPPTGGRWCTWRAGLLVQLSVVVRGCPQQEVDVTRQKSIVLRRVSMAVHSSHTREPTCQIY